MMPRPWSVFRTVTNEMAMVSNPIKLHLFQVSLSVVNVRDRAWFVRLYREIIPEL